MRSIWMALVLAGMWVALCGGDCNGDSDSCTSDAECDQGLFNLRCPGQMRCVGTECQAVCTSCELNEDCYGMAWSGDCDPAQWRCLQGQCSEVCSTSCASVDACTALAWGSDCIGHFECSNIYGCKEVCDEGCSVDTACRGPAVPDCGDRYTCHAGQCQVECGAECSTAQECEGLAWPGNLIEANCTGNWECQDGACTPVCGGPCTTEADCQGRVRYFACPGGWQCLGSVCRPACAEPCGTVADCLGLGWGSACGGHFSCVGGGCERICDAVGCGDGTCDAALGETLASCEVDCLPPCTSAADCASRAFDLPCQGRFECQAGDCVPQCDYGSCGDDSCQADQGEGEDSCQADCLAGCRTAADCVPENWLQMCTGRWTCFNQQCTGSCDSFTCGNGSCDPLQGESGGSCSSDCLRGGCTELVDCVALGWASACGGHWSCKDGNACEEVCDVGTCPDGTCDVLSGETDFTCPSDCVSYTCLVSADCADLPDPTGCADPDWLCVGKHCFARCR